MLVRQPLYFGQDRAGRVGTLLRPCRWPVCTVPAGSLTLLEDGSICSVLARTQTRERMSSFCSVHSLAHAYLRSLVWIIQFYRRVTKASGPWSRDTQENVGKLRQTLGCHRWVLSSSKQSECTALCASLPLLESDLIQCPGHHHQHSFQGGTDLKPDSTAFHHVGKCLCAGVGDRWGRQNHPLRRVWAMGAARHTPRSWALYLMGPVQRLGVLIQGSQGPESQQGVSEVTER